MAEELSLPRLFGAMLIIRASLCLSRRHVVNWNTTQSGEQNHQLNLCPAQSRLLTGILLRLKAEIRRNYPRLSKPTSNEDQAFCACDCRKRNIVHEQFPSSLPYE